MDSLRRWTSFKGVGIGAESSCFDVTHESKAVCFPLCRALRSEPYPHPYSVPVQTGMGEAPDVSLAQLLAWLHLYRKAVYFIKIFNP